jgi:hypothetical protein
LTKPGAAKPTLVFNLSVEEENLAAVPFAVLERRVGKRVGKLDIHGKKILPDGTEMEVLWQVQGNNDLGLPTEQDLDVFVALGVLTFQNNFAKTVTFTGREIAKILNIQGVHGKFYQRLKVAMDRFIPLRFRALTRTDRQEEVKWVNVFQEASFSLDRTTGRCTGQVTWTDKLIQSMNSGFFRLLDAGRYMELDGLTAKHLYRFLAVAFEKTDTVIIDARDLATKHLGIVSLPQYFSRLMQTLEPAFDQLVHVGVLGSYHVVEADSWRIGLRRHAAYVPERKALLEQSPSAAAAISRDQVTALLIKAGFSQAAAASYAAAASSATQFYALRRASSIVQALKDEQVLPHVALSLVRRALDAEPASPEATLQLDICELAVEVCRQKKAQGQKLSNSAGLIVKIVKDAEARAKMIPAENVAHFQNLFRQRESAWLQQAAYEEERDFIIEYEEFRRQLASACFQEMSSAHHQALRKKYLDLLQEQDRFEKMSPAERDREVEEMILLEIARKEAPPFEKWRLRRRAAQVTLPFLSSLPSLEADPHP